MQELFPRRHKVASSSEWRSPESIRQSSTRSRKMDSEENSGSNNPSFRVFVLSDWQCGHLTLCHFARLGCVDAILKCFF